MIGALKCCGAGARVLRNTSMGHGVSAASMDTANVGSGEVFLATSCCGNLNWSQKRFLRGNGFSANGPRNANAQFVIKEIENLKRLKGDVNSSKAPSFKDQEKDVNLELELRKYSRSLRGLQALLTTLPNYKENAGHKDLSEVSKIIIEENSPNVRAKSKKDEALLKEWLGIQRELRSIKRERMVDYKRKFQIAGEQVLKEMETSLKKGMNLDDLDQAIEGALCSQSKAECSNKSSHDN